MTNRAAQFRNAAPPGSTVVERGRSFIRQQKPDGSFILDTVIGSIHYGPSQDQEIDTTIIDADPVLDAPWLHKMVENDFNVFFAPGNGEFDSGQIIRYVHDSGEDITFQPLQLQWTNDLDQIQAISNPASVTPIIFENEITYFNAYGTDIDVMWRITGDKLVKLLTINSPAALPPPIGIDDVNRVLKLQFIFQKSTNVEIVVGGVLWDEKANNPQATNEVVEFRLKTTQEVLWKFGLPSAFDSDASDDPYLPIVATSLLRKTGPNLIVEILVPEAWLASAAYPVYIDPTIDPEITASNLDATEGRDDADFSSINVFNYCTSGTSVSASDASELIFAVTGPASTDTIDVSYITVEPQNTSNDDANCDIHCEDVDDAADFTSNADVVNRTLTTASVSWVQDGLGSSPVNSPSIVSPVQEVIDRGGWASGNNLGVVVLGKGDVLKSFRFDAYDRSAHIPALHIEYTPGAGGRATKNTDAQPLGIHTGMAWRLNTP